MTLKKDYTLDGLIMAARSDTSLRWLPEFLLTSHYLTAL